MDAHGKDRRPKATDGRTEVEPVVLKALAETDRPHRDGQREGGREGEGDIPR